MKMAKKNTKKMLKGSISPHRVTRCYGNTLTTQRIPLFLLLLLPLELLQVFLGHLDDVAGLFLRRKEGRREGGGASVERRASGGPRQALPEVLVEGLALQKFGSVGEETHFFVCFFCSPAVLLKRLIVGC